MESWRWHAILLQIMLLLVLLALPAVADCKWEDIRDGTHHYEGNHTAKAYKKTFRDGETAPYKCQRGYVVSTSLYSGPPILNATCRGNKWEFDPRNLVCRAISCGHPCLPHGSCENGDVSPPVFNFPSEVKFTCKQGYHLVTHDDQPWDRTYRVYCKSNGKWSRPAPKCVEVVCPQPAPIGNGQVGPQQPIFRENDVIQYTCNPPHTLNGDATRRCQNNATWSGSEPTCEKRCPPPKELLYGEIKSNGDYGVGALIIYVCDDDQRGSATCGEDLKWRPDPPVCKDTKQKPTPALPPPPPRPPPTTTASTPLPATQCSPLSSPTSGKLFSSDGFKINASVFFTCDEGYTLHGPATLICRPTGIWDPLTTPTCTAPPPWIIILSVCLAVLASLVLCCLGFFYIMRRRRRRTPPPRSYRRQIRKPGPYDAISNDEVARLGKPFPVTSL